MSSVLPTDLSTRHAAACGRGAPSSASSHGPPNVGAAVIAAAVLAQALALAWLAGAGAEALPPGVAAAGLCSLAWRRRARLPRLDVVIATAAFGGLGMMAGEWVARGIASPAHGVSHGGASPGAWIAATTVMLLTCAGACRWSCAPLCHGGWRRRMMAHLIAAGGMLGGMHAAGAVVAAPLASIAGAAAGMHLAMVLGMAGGVAAVLPLIAMVDVRLRAPGDRPSG